MVTTPLVEVVARLAETSTESETTRICPFAAVVVKAEDELNVEVLKTMSPAIVFAADDGTAIAEVFDVLPTSSLLALEDTTMSATRERSLLKLSPAG
jgi:hypothetical protein